MKNIGILSLVLLLFFNCLAADDITKITQFQTYPHTKKCYTQGLFFLNQTHVFQSCGLYNVSYYRVLRFQQNDKSFKIVQTYSSEIPIDKNAFLQGATWLPKTDNIYLLTWREKQVFKLNRNTFSVEQIQSWQKDGWGLTNNDTHMFVTDGGAVIYVVDQNFNILNQKTILDQNGRKVYSINELEYVVQNGKAFIYANIYMERRIVKIDIEAQKVVKEYDLLKLIQNQKGLHYDQVINGIAYHQKSGKFLLTGKNWGNFYLISFN